MQVTGSLCQLACSYSTISLCLFPMQLLGVTCLWLAAKYEEVNPPTSYELAVATDGMCDPRQMAGMEKAVSDSLSVLFAFFQHQHVQQSLNTSCPLSCLCTRPMPVTNTSDSCICSSLTLNLCYRTLFLSFMQSKSKSASL